MRTVPHVSDSEWEVMQVLWDLGTRVPASDVVAALAGRRAWNDRTIKTLLNRLVKKGAVAYEAAGKHYLYRPNVKRDDCVRHESRSFVSRVFGGRAGEMLCRLVDEADLSADEIAQIQTMLDRKRR